MFVNGPSDKNPTNANQQFSSSNTQSQKDSGSIFDKLFGKTLIAKKLDTNKDGTISINEVSDYIQSSNASRVIIKFISTFLGIKQGEPGADPVAKIMEKLNILKLADTDKDGDISNEEIKNAQSFESSKRKIFNEIMGVADGKINNKQGGLGSCWLLAPSKALSDKGMLSDILQVDDEYNVTITLCGTENEEGKPYTYTFSRTEIMKHKSGSTDADAVALEMAVQKYNDDLESRNMAVSEKIEEYINSSTPILPEKPSADLLTSDISEEDWTKFYNYYINSTGEDKYSIIITGNLRFADDREKMIADMRNYLANSEPALPEKPDSQQLYFGFMSSVVVNYLRNSYSDTVEKPETQARLFSPGNFTMGGNLDTALKLMYGEACESKVYKNDETEPDVAKNIIADSSGSNNIITVSFKNQDDCVITNHAYYVQKSDNKFVYLSNPHNSDVYIKYSKKDFIKNYKELAKITINTEKLKELKTR